MRTTKLRSVDGTYLSVYCRPRYNLKSPSSGLVEKTGKTIHRGDSYSSTRPGPWSRPSKSSYTYFAILFVSWRWQISRWSLRTYGGGTSPGRWGTVVSSSILRLRRRQLGSVKHPWESSSCDQSRTSQNLHPLSLVYPTVLPRGLLCVGR